MATKKKPNTTKSKSATKPQPRATAPARPQLDNLAARPSYEDLNDEQLVDHSGVFRVTSSIAQAQTGHGDEESLLRFASDSLVMAAQRDGFRDDGVTIDDVADEHSIVDAATEAEKKQRLATLAARAQRLRDRSRR